MGYIREKLDYSRESILLSVEKSCSGCRPTTSICINFMAERKVNFFGQRGFKIEEDPWQDNFQGILETLQELVVQEKSVTLGFLRNALGIDAISGRKQKHDLPKMVTIQMRIRS
jgi:hypothetical protein